MISNSDVDENTTTVNRSLRISTGKEEEKYRLKAYPDVSVVKDARLQCTVCHNDIKIEILHRFKVHCHIYLNVLLCKSCFEFYGTGEFSLDEDGLDKYCRWCGQGGKLFICNDCPTAFCKKCIKRNMPRKVLHDIKQDNWKCFVCSPEPLYEHRALCWAVEQYVANEKKTLEKKLELEKVIKDEKIPLENGVEDVSRSGKRKEFLRLCSELKSQCLKMTRACEKSLKSVRETHSDKVDYIYQASRKTRTSADDFQLEIERIKKILTENFMFWEKELENRRVKVDEINLDSDDEFVKGDSDIKAVKDNKIDSNKNKISDEINVNEEVTEPIVLEDEEENNCEDKHKEQKEESTEEKIEAPKSFLRVRNVEELNKAISEDKIGDLMEVGSNVKEEKSKDSDNDSVRAVEEMPVIMNEANSEEGNCDKQKEESRNESPENSSSSESKPTNKNSAKQRGKKSAKEEKGKKKKPSEKNDSDSTKNGSDNTKNDSDNIKNDSDNIKNDSEKISGSSSLGGLTSSENNELASSSEWETKKKNTKKSPAKGKTRKSLRSSAKKTPDSDDDIKKLLDERTLKKRKRTFSSSGSDSSAAGAELKKEKQKEKKPPRKKKEEKKPDSSDSDLNDVDSDGSKIDLNELVSKAESFKAKDHYSNMMENLLTIKSGSESDDEGSDDLFSSSDKEKKKKTKEKKTGKMKSGSEKENESDSDIDSKKKKTNQWKKDKLLRGKLSGTDSSEEERKWKEKQQKGSLSKKKKMAHRGKRKKLLSSDSGSNFSEPEKKESSSEESEVEPEVKSKKRKRIQRASTSGSDDPDEKKCPDSGNKGRKNIRKVLKEEGLQKSTLEALKEEQERKKRISERQKLYNKMLEVTEEKKSTVVEKVVLDFDADDKKEIISVDPELVKKMKPHQAEGVKFMWDACFESLKLAKKTKGSGCILAHCMGLGKTFQVVTLVHTLLVNEEVGIRTVLVVAPLSTVQNWVNEFEKWLQDIGSGKDIEIFKLDRAQVNHRSYMLKDWQKTGGVMVMGYNMFRTLINPTKRTKPSVKKAFEECLLDPGPDLVICDEGHILKNESTALSTAMSKIRTRRRIVLTGTPLQNNLVEYHCMVQFVKPNLLGTKKEFKNRFVNPITNGQFEDSTAHDVKVMKRRAHVLHKLLDGIVQRKDYNVLTPYLPTKFEYVISLSLTEIQSKLYMHYLDHLSRGGEVKKGATLFKDWQSLSRICSHPRVLLMHSDREQLKRKDYSEEDSEGSLKNFIDDDSDESDTSSSSSSSSSSKSGDDSDKKEVIPARSTRSNPVVEEVEPLEDEKFRRSEWWSDLVTENELEHLTAGAKMVLLFSILKKCEEIGDKLLVFSQSLITLDLIEYFLDKVSDLPPPKEKTEKKEEDKEKEGSKEDSSTDTSPTDEEKKEAEDPLEYLQQYSATWDKGVDYFRLDGGTATDLRTSFVSHFNNERNTRARLFLISTRAGGLGINLVGANRVIIFDASWNPSDDVQSIFRVFRFGQKKPCYIYRFLAQGTMEEKIYERQIAKLSISRRVVDEQQVERHFSHNDLTELYTYNPEKVSVKQTPMLPKDRLMAELLQLHSNLITAHHQHDSLLENQEEEDLNEEERKQAWNDFENEKNAPPPPPPQILDNSNVYWNQLLLMISRLKAQNPTWSDGMLQSAAHSILMKYSGSLIAPKPQMVQPQITNYQQQGATNMGQGMMYQNTMQGAPFSALQSALQQNPVFQHMAQGFKNQLGPNLVPNPKALINQRPMGKPVTGEIDLTESGADEKEATSIEP